MESFNRRGRIQCDSCDFYRFSGVLVVWWWQETPSSSSQSLASLSCLEEEMISAGSSGRVGVDSRQLEREMDRWMGGWLGRWILTQIDCRLKGMCVCHSSGWYSCFSVVKHQGLWARFAPITTNNRIGFLLMCLINVRTKTLMPTRLVPHHDPP